MSGEVRRADYIVVGAGSAGAVIASRLSEDPKQRVLLIEAGESGRHRHILVAMPVGFARMIGNDKFDWNYRQDPDPSINGRQFIWSAGKMLGGGSSINGQVYIRGTRRDYDWWAEMGATGWDFESVMPYFRRSEHWYGAPNQARGVHGPLSVSPIRDPHPLCQVFLAGCREIGLPTLEDYNGGQMEGAYLTQASQRHGWRCSTEKGYLREARKRSNLEIVTDCTVEKVLIKDGRAVGVAVTRGGVRDQMFAHREVIVSAGAMGSPALLMRSGIGPGKHLTERGIEVILDRPAVGANLQEHPGVVLDKYVNQPTYNTKTGPIDMALNLTQFFWNQTGPMSVPAISAMAQARTRDGLDEPDVMLHFAPMAYDVAAEAEKQTFTVMPKEPGMFIATSLCHPKSRGRVVLDKDLQPHVEHRLLGDPDDVETLVRGCKLIERLFKSPSIARVVVGDRVPNPVPATDDEWAELVRKKANPTYHPCGTCRMGSDDDAVVDPQLRVRGIAGLRVADASVMPRVTSANTNAATVMVGEKAAEMVAAYSHDWRESRPNGGGVEQPTNAVSAQRVR